ncbi:MAG: hypothetical protein ACI9FJ_003022 [Alteromonadaceae bacterium]|jgi:hypothetical protein
MAIKETPQTAFMSQQIDLLHPVFLQWFGKKFPECQKVVIFDKNDTLISTVNGRRSCHQHLIKEVVMGLARLKPKVVLVMYTVTDIQEMQSDLNLFPKVFAPFDLIITADNYSHPLLKSFCDKGRLKGNPFLLQLRRMSKPVGEIFANYPVTLIDRYVGTDWIAAKQGVDGIKAYKFAHDNPRNAKKMVQKLVKQINQKRSKRGARLT